MAALIDYNAVLADLEAKRADLEAKRGQVDTAIAVVRALIEGAGSPTFEIAAPSAELSVSRTAAAVPAPATPSPQEPASPALASDVFFGLTTAAALEKYLKMVTPKRPQPANVLAAALVAGGQAYARDKKTAYTNVQTALRRHGGMFTQTRTGEWGLAEWYRNKPKGADGE